MLTLEILQKFCFGNKDTLQTYISPLNKTLQKFDISNKNRQAAFLAQVIVESGSFKYVSENLNYSVDGLLKTFGKYFDVTSANAYARNPEKIANRVYAKRMGNGDEKSGDGWKFRGRGLIQLTGKNNYTNAAAFFQMDVDTLITYLETPEGAAMTAGWFWHTSKLNSLADSGNIGAINTIVNGGKHGFQDRVNYYNKALTVL